MLTEAEVTDSERCEPVQVEKRARDVTPYLHGIYCTVGGGEPFVNEIALRRWSEDGTQIVFMLESHNFDFRDPDEMMLVVERTPKYITEATLARALHEDAERMTKRPVPTRICEHCGGTGKLRCGS